MRIRLSSLLIVGTLVATACTASPSQPSPGSRSSSVAAGGALDATYRTGPIRFRYPSGWTTRRSPGFVSTFSDPLVALSNQEMTEPCVPGSQTCTFFPIQSLDPGGLMLHWSASGRPGWKFREQSGRVVTVDGRPAKISTDNPVCGPLTSDRSLAVIVSRPGVRDNWYQLDGCFREPGADAAISEVMALLQTVRISGRLVRSSP
jgi:hypothetical protein